MYCVCPCCRTHGRARRGRRPLLPRPSLSRGVRRPPATAATPTPVRLARAASAGCYCRALARPRPARARRVPHRCCRGRPSRARRVPRPQMHRPSHWPAPRPPAAAAAAVPLARAPYAGHCCSACPARAPLPPKIALPPAAAAAYGEDDAGASWDGGRRRQ